MSLILLYLFFWILIIILLYNLPLIIYGITYPQISAIKNDNITNFLSELIKNLGLTDSSISETISEIEKNCAIISIIIISIGIMLTILTIKHINKISRERSALINEYRRRQKNVNRNE